MSSKTGDTGAKQWELVTWNGSFYAVGIELLRGSLNVVMVDRSKVGVMWFMERLPGWEDRPVREDVYDVDRAKGSQWDGRKERPGTRRKRY